MGSRGNEIRKSNEVVERADTLLAGIRNLILSARRAAVRSVDTLHVLTCFEIGRRIVEHEQQGLVRAEYGQYILRDLAERLMAEFGKGFSKCNLEYMRGFYSMYRDRSPSIPQTLSGQSGAGKKRQTPSGESALMPAIQFGFEAQAPGVGRRTGGAAVMRLAAILRAQQQAEAAKLDAAIAANLKELGHGC